MKCLCGVTSEEVVQLSNSYLGNVYDLQRKAVIFVDSTFHGKLDYTVRSPDDGTGAQEWDWTADAMILYPT